MEFKLPYVLAMREQDPKGFQQLVRSGMMERHLQEKALEARQMLDQLLADKPRDQQGNPNPADVVAAEEVVRGTLIDFPTPESDQNPEPPDDLPKR